MRRSTIPIEISVAGSKNGVYVNGVRCPHTVLRDGDVIRVGDSLLILRYEPVGTPDAAIDALLGISAGQRALRCRVAAIASSDTAVLLLGGSGTGKDLSAGVIHEHSQSRVALVWLTVPRFPIAWQKASCLGMWPVVLRAHKEIARDSLKRLITQTLFLDELGELSPRGQALLLRAIDDHSITPIGATTPRSCKVRIIAATNKS